MRLAEVALENFRGYRDRVEVPVDDLTVLIGRNDAGKSTILEALDIVLGEGKLEVGDACVQCAVGDTVVIECAFDVAEEDIVVDATSETTFANEHLLDEEGRLRVRWSWTVTSKDGQLGISKEKVTLFAVHPTAEGVDDLHSKTNAALKKMIEDKGLEELANRSSNVSMRAALWEHAESNGGLKSALAELELAKESGKEIFTSIRKRLPHYVLFKADRPSTDQDAEVQDPMRAAIKLAMEEVAEDLEAIKERVKARTLEVAERTIARLEEIDAALAASLESRFTSEPRWDSIFKFSLYDEAGIPINKRGSGVRRLVLIGFFRAEAEAMRDREPKRSVIYAIEEPETAQHPDNQKRLIQALKELSQQAGCQVLLTTHVPGLAELVPVESLRYVRQDGTGCKVQTGDDDSVLELIASSLGVLPRRTVKLLVCVEGPTDVAMLTRLARLWRTEVSTLPDLESDPRIAMIPLGGEALRAWVERRYLQKIGVPEYHLYDRDEVVNGKPKYQDAVDQVNARGNGHSARLTVKREVENYAHPDAVGRVLSRVLGQSVSVEYGDDDNVLKVIGEAIPDDAGKPRKNLKRRSLKNWVTTDVASEMTLEELKEIDPLDEVKGWLEDIAQAVREPAGEAAVSF